jgi:hypothetical protein
MRNMLRCRRGSVAFATVVALVPLIGFVALGAEVGSWYVTKQQAQNAADAAAYSGALTLGCSFSSASSNCDTGALLVLPAGTQLYDYRGEEFAAQNGFCNTGGTFPNVTCPTGLSQTVLVEQGTYAGGTWTSSASGSFVRATVSQTQPTYLAAVLGLYNVTIGGSAIAEVQNPKDLCALGLSPTSIALTLGGGGTLTGDGCALMSNNTVKYASTPTFQPPAHWSVEAVNGCTNSGNCDPGVPYNYTMLPATNPLKPLDTASFNSWTSTGKPNDLACTGTLTPNNSTNLYRNLTCTNGNTVTFSPGTYFFYNGAIKINGGIVSGTGVTLVLLGNSSLSISGGTVNLSAPATNTFSSALNGVLIDDQAPNHSSNNVTINGSSTVSLFGALYFPNVDVKWIGTTANVNTGCTEVIANTITISGTANFSTGSCVTGTVAKTQVVALVK